MKKTRAYIDTSVFGGCFDEEFSEASNGLFKSLRKGYLIAIVSELVVEELNDAPQDVKNVLTGLPEEFVENVKLDEEAMALAEEYIKAKVVSENSLRDARHVAMATCANVNVLLSWNFKDLVNLTKIKGFNSINLRMGYGEIEIRSPLEVRYEEEV